MKDFISDSSLILFGIIVGVTLFTIQAPDVVEASRLLYQAADSLDHKDEIIVDLKERLEDCDSQTSSEEKPMSYDQKLILNLQPVKPKPQFRK